MTHLWKSAIVLALIVGLANLFFTYTQIRDLRAHTRAGIHQVNETAGTNTRIVKQILRKCCQ